MKMEIKKDDWRLSPRFEYREDLVKWLNKYKVKHFEVLYAPAKDIQVVYKPSYENLIINKDK